MTIFLLLWKKLKCKIQPSEVAELANFFFRGMIRDDINTECYSVHMHRELTNRTSRSVDLKGFPMREWFYHNVFIPIKKLSCKVWMWIYFDLKKATFCPASTRYAWFWVWNEEFDVKKVWKPSVKSAKRVKNKLFCKLKRLASSPF